MAISSLIELKTFFYNINSKDVGANYEQKTI